ncbi:RNA polymerase sigma factor (sigma-70 family) [Actinocorallia herbida]|uniref:RNA polymerase sigma factor (Sigma-70 family) n=1 Tax=Actinocorallia herbida TaxID=58109 RepID=A0A3N1CV71_9ACTN|nr:RNA polymerase sigma factor [Actinocorallia herbida]ROO85135.1 RNA polymerase sigma factor (sigma-70 family) [Actinocorallia herbida]
MRKGPYGRRSPRLLKPEHDSAEETDRSAIISVGYRAETRRNRLLARAPAAPPVEPFEERSAAKVTSAQLQPRLAKALTRLSAADRDLLLLVAWADLTYEQCAEALGVPLGTVRSRLHRIRAAFRAIARIPGVEVRSTGTDPLGRPVVAITRLDQWGVRISYVIDPETYSSRDLSGTYERSDLMRRPPGVYFGENGLPTPDPSDRRGPLGAGDWDLRESAGIVDEPGERP